MGRHHCRLCGRCVCSTCSPNFMSLEEGQRPQRVCSPCAGIMGQGVAAEPRLARLVQRLDVLTGLESRACPQVLQPLGLIQDLGQAEEALAILEALHGVEEDECGASAQADASEVFSPAEDLRASSVSINSPLQSTCATILE